jgi:hypothetical protein
MFAQSKQALYICINKNGKTMTTLKNTTGSKAVNITTDATGNVRAMYVQIYNGEQQVLQAKTFTTVKNAEKWANKILN